MTTRHKTLMGIVAVLAAAVLAVWAANRRYAFLRAAPAWLDPQQPPEGVAASWGALNPAESRAANSTSPMTACCAGRGAGRRIRRTYPDTLAASPHSFIRAGFDLAGGC